jgi:pimeloyl-ACP methyl ester carboxylesterase
MSAHTVSSVTKDFEKGPHAFVDMPEGRLATWKFGRGPDVVLVHGWPLHGATFRKIIPLLADKFTLHVIDLPGTGKTEWDASARIDLETHAAVVRRFVDHLGLEAYALLAHDSGAMIARLVAAEDSRVRALVMGNTEIPGHRPWLVEAYVALAKIPSAVRLTLAGLRLGAIRRSALGFGGCFDDARYVDGEFGELFVRPLFSSKRVAHGQTRLLETLDFALIDGADRVHAKIQAPVLCIWGTDDPFFPLEKARRMLPQFAGGAKLVEITGAKLFAHEDRAEEFAAAARVFLRAMFAPSWKAEAAAPPC